MRKPALLAFVLIAVASLAIPSTSAAQTAIAGVVRDMTGAVLPGVTIEVKSPAIIGGVRASVSDDNGQYRIVDLRPGTYSVTFTLPGFTTVVREGLVLETNFTAPVNAEMRVGALTETVTVSGESPVVDVQTTQRQEPLNRALLDALPTGRDWTTQGNVLPSVQMGRFDVGGSSTTQSGTLVAFGSRGEDASIQMDGINATNAWGEGWWGATYHNEADYEEVAFTTASASAESRTGGVLVNMIPRIGSNVLRLSSVLTYTNERMEGTNIDDDLRAKGFNLAGGLDHMYDANLSVGGPIKRDRVWFYGSIRRWAFFNKVPGITNRDGTQVISDDKLGGHTGRGTVQIGNTRINGSHAHNPRDRWAFGIEALNGAPEAFSSYPNRPHQTAVRSATTLSSQLLLEAGYLRNYWFAELIAHDDVRLATCFVAFDQCPAGTDYGDIRKTDLVRDWTWNAPGANDNDYETVRHSWLASMSWVTGQHNFKVGFDYSKGNRMILTRMSNGAITQRYRSGVPDSVSIPTQPSITDTNIDAEIGIYVQDSWTRGRLTMNPGLRFDYIKDSISDQTAAVGRFLPERRFTQADYVELPTFRDVSPRFGLSYDLFGNGKTALKGSLGRYVQSFASNLADSYNPMGGGSDTRTWTDRNGDDIAQESELGPSSNRAFGQPAGVATPDPNMQRPYQMLYNVAVQQEVRRGLSVTLGYYRRNYYDETWTDNLATTHADYSIIPVPDPRGNGQTINVYSISPAKFGLVDNYVTNSSENGRTYNGVDLSFIARLPNGIQFQGGVNGGKVHDFSCEVDDPNDLLNCDRNYPFQTAFKMSGAVPLPYGFRVSGVFASLPGLQESRSAANVGEDFAVTYSIGRAIAPGLTQPTENVRLSSAGEYFLDRSNQLDFAIARDFQVNKLRVRPSLDLYNALNANPVISAVNTYGPSFLSPRAILNARLMKVNVRLDF
jgi:hypothetical protein